MIFSTFITFRWEKSGPELTKTIKAHNKPRCWDRTASQSPSSKAPPPSTLSSGWKLNEKICLTPFQVTGINSCAVSLKHRYNRRREHPPAAPPNRRLTKRSIQTFSPRQGAVPPADVRQCTATAQARGRPKGCCLCGTNWVELWLWWR